MKILIQCHPTRGCGTLAFVDAEEPDIPEEALPRCPRCLRLEMYPVPELKLVLDAAR